VTACCCSRCTTVYVNADVLSAWLATANLFLQNCSCSPPPPPSHALASRPRSQSIQHFFRQSRESHRFSPAPVDSVAAPHPHSPAVVATSQKAEEGRRINRQVDKSRRRFRDTVISVLRMRSSSNLNKHQEHFLMPSAPHPSGDTFAGSKYRQLRDPGTHVNHGMQPGTVGVVHRQMNGNVTDHGTSRDEDTHPASVESLVRRCAECFGECTFCREQLLNETCNLA